MLENPVQECFIDHDMMTVRISYYAKGGFCRLLTFKQYVVRMHICKQYVSMIRKYHNHKPQTTPWHREEEPLNHHETH